MDQVFAITLSSMHQDMNRLDRIASNLTNAATPGYRREVAAARPFTDALSEAAMGQGAAPAAPSLSVPMLQVLHDNRAGSLKMTGEPLDLAVTGDAFLEVSTDQGPAYTRRGDLRLDGRSRLVTAQGHPVMGKGGEIFLSTRTPVIDADGNVTEPNATSGPGAGGRPIAQIKLVRFEHPERLQSLGEGLVAPGEGMALVGEGEGQLKQGALENSNVSTLQEMVQMIQTTRHFETMQKITQSYDEMMGSAVHKLGDMS